MSGPPRTTNSRRCLRGRRRLPRARLLVRAGRPASRPAAHRTSAAAPRHASARSLAPPPRDLAPDRSGARLPDFAAPGLDRWHSAKRLGALDYASFAGRELSQMCLEPIRGGPRLTRRETVHDELVDNDFDSRLQRRPPASASVSARSVFAYST